jgi:hypothetical protein
LAVSKILATTREEPGGLHDSLVCVCVLVCLFVYLWSLTKW